jgi:hypothetical protein
MAEYFDPYPYEEPRGAGPFVYTSKGDAIGRFSLACNSYSMWFVANSPWMQ